MCTASIAIWNGKRFVIVIAAGVWVANVGFMIQCKPFHPVSCIQFGIAQIMRWYQVSRGWIFIRLELS